MQTLPDPVGTPSAEVEADEQLVRQLLEICHPDLSELPLQRCDSGWDNFILRLGDDLAVRLPRRQSAVALILNEQAWLPRIAPGLPVPVPSPLRCGTPAAGFPWPWSVIPWIHGTTSDTTPFNGDQAKVWLSFLTALHSPAPKDAPPNPYRGVPLRFREDAFLQRYARLSTIPNLIPSQLRGIWEAALEAEESTESVWLHGDLHGRNVLNLNGRLAGVIDWGDITAGDPATDIASAWTLFNFRQDRQTIIENYNAHTVARARGWAALFALAHLDAGLVDNPIHKSIGERILRNLVD